MNADKSSWTESIELTWPVMLGYVPMGTAFGILCGDFYQSVSQGLFIFAGSAQFLSVKLIATKTNLVEFGFAIFLLNLRHFFYGLHFRHKYERLPWLKRLYCTFALTDETYAVLSHQQNESLFTRVSFLNQSAWVFGCAIGGLLGSKVGAEVKGLDFILTAVFVILMVDKLKSSRRWIDAGVALAVGVIFLSTHIKIWLFLAMAVAIFYSYARTRGPA